MPVERNKDGLVYDDRAHVDAMGGLQFMGLWDFTITPDMVGKTLGQAIDDLLKQDDVPYHIGGA